MSIIKKTYLESTKYASLEPRNYILNNTNIGTTDYAHIETKLVNVSIKPLPMAKLSVNYDVKLSVVLKARKAPFDIRCMYVSNNLYV